MALKFEQVGLYIPKSKDKRVKLLPEDKVKIVELYATGDYSQRLLAERFGVSRRLIGFILNPESHKRNLEIRDKRGGSGLYYNKEANTVAMRKHREHKKALYETDALETRG